MKKGFKIAGALLGVAAVAATVPYAVTKDSETGEKTIEALLWRLNMRPNTETGKKDITIDIFPNRLPCKPSTDIPEEELICEDAVQTDCDIELTLDPKLDDEEPASTSVDVEA